MSKSDELFQEFPAGSRQLIQGVWDTLSPQRQEDLLTLLPLLPGQPGKIQKIFELGHQQIQMNFGNKHKVAIVGPANVGKSTLYNQFIQSKKDVALVSPVPGTTKLNQEAPAGPFTIVDTPGADAVGEVGDKERQLALQAAAQADFLIIIFDAIQGIKRTEQELFQELKSLYKPYLVVLNKIDLVRQEAQTVVNQAAQNLGLPPDQVIPIAAKDNTNLERVLRAIIKAEPSLLVALGQGLPGYRWQLAWQAISGAASTSALIALTPLPFMDFIPLIAVQTSLILGVARIYNYKITPGRWREVASVFGLGYLGKTLFYELAKLGGPPGWLVAAAVAAGTTVGMGYAAILWFERGERLTGEAARQISKTVTAYLIESLKNLGKQKPSRQKLSERIQEALRHYQLRDKAQL